MKRGILLFFLGAMLLLVPSVLANGSWSFELVAGQNTPIGTVNVSISGTTLTATYNVTAAGWCMSTTHFFAGNTPPSNAPGQFNYKHDGLDCVTTDTFVVTTPTGDVFVAAHADSHFDPANASEPTDPLTGIATIVPVVGSSAYFNVTTTGGINGSYEAWCIDLSNFITSGQTYTANVHTEVSGSLVDFPENIDLVNYVMNQDYSAWGATMTDVQTAIWLLIDDTVPVMITALARDIEADARANGEGFVAGCGGVVGVIVEPIENNAQHLILEYPAPCPVEGNPRSETAWALASWGVEFGQGWGMYFWLVDAPDSAPPNEEPTDTPPDEATPPPDDTADNGNRSRRDESPGYGGAEEPPADRSDESNGNGNGNGNGGGNGNGNNNGNGRNN